MEKVKAYQITLIVDQQWLNTISEVTSYVEDGEICSWDSVSDPFDEYPEKYWMRYEDFLKILEGEK